MKLGLPLCAILVLLVGGAGAAAAQDQPSLTYETALRAAEAAEAEARRNNWNVTIVVTDAEAIPVYLKRLTGASARSYDIAMRKARTSVTTGLTTGVYGERLEAGQVAEVPEGITFQGGVPIILDGRVVGAVGTSGVRASEDEQVSRAGVEAITP
jgi:glc operon protein GlcG